jgi:hypothetical protein
MILAKSWRPAMGRIRACSRPRSLATFQADSTVYPIPKPYTLNYAYIHPNARRSAETPQLHNETSTKSHWFNFHAKKLLEQYQKPYGEDFCLVINCSSAHDDAYVLPFGEVKHCFLGQYLDVRNRWCGNVVRENLIISVDEKEMERLDISGFHDAFELLKDAPKPLPVKDVFLP